MTLYTLNALFYVWIKCSNIWDSFFLLALWSDLCKHALYLSRWIASEIHTKAKVRSSLGYGNSYTGQIFLTVVQNTAECIWSNV